MALPTFRNTPASDRRCSDEAGKIIDECVQLHGGYGYMMEYPIAKFYLDHRVNAIYGGTNEIMKEIIGRRELGL